VTWWRTRPAGSIDALPRLIGQLIAREILSPCRFRCCASAASSRALVANGAGTACGRIGTDHDLIEASRVWVACTHTRRSSNDPQAAARYASLGIEADGLGLLAAARFREDEHVALLGEVVTQHRQTPMCSGRCCRPGTPAPVSWLRATGK
jgi:hypothetical protein